MKFAMLPICGDDTILHYSEKDLSFQMLSESDREFILEFGLPLKISDCGDVKFSFMRSLDKVNINGSQLLKVASGEFGDLVYKSTDCCVYLLVDGELYYLNSSIRQMIECFSVYKTIHADNPIKESGVPSKKLYSDYAIRGNDLKKAISEIDSRAAEASVIWLVCD